MRPDTGFRGRFLHVTESLAVQDAVSDHVIALHELLLSQGFRSEIFTVWHDPLRAAVRQDLDAMRATEHDIVILHFCGRSEHALAAVLAAPCTRVMQYHNITPAEFFPLTSRYHAFCLEGREQLRSSIGAFHHCWADSAFNLDELIDLRGSSINTAVVPIVVPRAQVPHARPQRRAGSWLFVGRIAPNKRQADLVRLFAHARRVAPELAQSLTLAGNSDEADTYYQEVVSAVGASGLAPFVRLAGKVPDAERERLYCESAVYVSLSEHEGFGVPLVEAGARGLSVVALDCTAVGETLGHGPGVAARSDAIWPLVQKVQTDAAFRQALLAHQFANAQRFEPGAVEQALGRALQALLPQR